MIGSGSAGNPGNEYMLSAGLEHRLRLRYLCEARIRISEWEQSLGRERNPHYSDLRLGFENPIVLTYLKCILQRCSCHIYMRLYALAIGEADTAQVETLDIEN